MCSAYIYTYILGTEHDEKKDDADDAGDAESIVSSKQLAALPSAFFNSRRSLFAFRCHAVIDSLSGARSVRRPIY